MTQHSLAGFCTVNRQPLVNKSGNMPNWLVVC